MKFVPQVFFLKAKIFCLFLILSVSRAFGAQKKPFELHQAHFADNYQIDTNSEVQNRTILPPPFFLNYLRKTDRAPEYKGYSLSSAEKELFKKYFELLPKAHQRILHEKVIAIFFIENLKSAGQAHFLLAESDRYAIIILNPKILSTSMPDWLNFRDNSTFQNNPQMRLSSKIQTDHLELLHTLIHEASHVYDFLRYVTPYMDAKLYYAGLGLARHTAFTAEVWEVFDEPLAQFDFPNRSKVSAYGFGKRLDAKFILPIYENLSRTPYLTLYAAQTWSEDYAETVSWCYMEKAFKIQYSVDVISNGKTIFNFTPFTNPSIRSRCKAVLETLD